LENGKPGKDIDEKFSMLPGQSLLYKRKSRRRLGKTKKEDLR